MALFDVLVVAGVLFFFAYIIFAKMHSNNPVLIDKIKGWIDRKNQEKVMKAKEITQQVYVDKRELI